MLRVAKSLVAPSPDQCDLLAYFSDIPPCWAGIPLSSPTGMGVSLSTPESTGEVRSAHLVLRRNSITYYNSVSPG